jgi:hypothetical protein
MGFAASLPFHLIAQHEWFQAGLGDNLAMPARNSLRDAANKGNPRPQAQLKPFGDRLAGHLWEPVRHHPLGLFRILNGSSSEIC